MATIVFSFLLILKSVLVFFRPAMSSSPHGAINYNSSENTCMRISESLRNFLWQYQNTDGSPLQCRLVWLPKYCSRQLSPAVHLAKVMRERALDDESEAHLTPRERCEKAIGSLTPAECVKYYKQCDYNVKS